MKFFDWLLQLTGTEELMSLLENDIHYQEWQDYNNTLNKISYWESKIGEYERPIDYDQIRISVVDVECRYEGKKVRFLTLCFKAVGFGTLYLKPNLQHNLFFKRNPTLCQVTGAFGICNKEFFEFKVLKDFRIRPWIKK